MERQIIERLDVEGFQEVANEFAAEIKVAVIRQRQVMIAALDVVMAGRDLLTIGGQEAMEIMDDERGYLLEDSKAMGGE